MVEARNFHFVISSSPFIIFYRCCLRKTLSGVIMKEEETDEIDWELGTEHSELVGKPKVLEYDYGLFDKDFNLLDFVPTSALTTDLMFEELTSPSTLDLEDQQPNEVKLEETEPCAAAAAIEANIPSPGRLLLSKWRTFISTVYFHPNILVHEDVSCLKELFQLLGEEINFGSINIMIDLGQTVKDYKPVSYLRPALPSNQKPQIFNFAHVKDFFIDMELKVCIVTKYGISDSMKRAVAEMVTFIVEYPEALYLEVYGFILDFLLKFGVQSEMIIDAVMRTQTRRRKLQRPASVLILKKANSLGKGKKEFLQQKMMESPDQQYHPVIPIISEPPPVRTLRNRRTGGIGFNSHVNNTTAPVVTPPIASNLSTENSQSSASYNAPVFAVKRKLFVEDAPNRTTTTTGLIDSTQTFPRKDCSGATGYTLSRKKRFYGRRDSSTIEKPFTCSICSDRSFAYKGNLVLHMKKKHQFQRPVRQENRVPAFSCPVCLQGYASKYKCKAHIQRVHPEHADWPAIANEEAVSQRKKTTTNVKRVRIATGNGVVRRSTRQSLAPLSQTQNSSSESEKPSHVTLNSNLDYGSGRRLPPLSGKQQLNFPIRSGVPVKLKGYSPLNPARTRRHFRAAVK